MIRSLFKFIFFILPAAILNGLTLIFFENLDITRTVFEIKKRKNYKEIKKDIINNYLKKCRQMVYKEDSFNAKKEKDKKEKD